MKTYTIIIPTIKDRFGIYKYEFVDTMIPSMACLNGLGRNWEVAINFQLYSWQECERLCWEISRLTGLVVRYVLNDYSGSPVSMRRVRHACAEVCPDSDYYVFVDDNFKYQPGVVEFFSKVDEYLCKYPDCGWLQCKGHLGGYHHEDEIIPAIVSYWWTDRSLFLKNLFPEQEFYLFPSDSLDIPGGFEEPHAVFHRMAMGYHGAKVYNSPIVHKRHNSHEEYELVERRVPVEHDTHNPKNNELACAYIVEQWGDTTDWLRNQRVYLPKGVRALYYQNCRNIGWNDSILEW